MRRRTVLGANVVSVGPNLDFACNLNEYIVNYVHRSPKLSGVKLRTGRLLNDNNNKACFWSKCTRGNIEFDSIFGSELFNKAPPTLLFPHFSPLLPSNLLPAKNAPSLVPIVPQQLMSSSPHDQPDDPAENKDELDPQTGEDTEPGQ